MINSECQKRRVSHTRLTENKRKQTSGRQFDREKQTAWRHSNEKSEHRRTTSEAVNINKSALYRPITSENEERELKQIRNSIRNTIQLSRSPLTCKLITSSSKASNSQNSTMQTAYSSDTESQQSNVFKDQDVHISITQAKIDHLKKADYRIRFIGNQAEVDRPNKEARAELKVRTQRLGLHYETRRKAKTSDKPQPTQTFRKQA